MPLQLSLLLLSLLLLLLPERAPVVADFVVNSEFGMRAV